MEQRINDLIALLEKEGLELPRDFSKKLLQFEAELLDSLRKGYFDTTLVEVEVIDAPKEMEVPTGGATIAIGSIFGDMFPQKKKKRKLTVKEAKEIFLAEEAEKLVDDDAVKAEAIRRAENDRIIFIDQGVIVEEGPAEQLINNPQHERTRAFLTRYED